MTAQLRHDVLDIGNNVQAEVHTSSKTTTVTLYTRDCDDSVYLHLSPDDAASLGALLTGAANRIRQREADR